MENSYSCNLDYLEEPAIDYPQERSLNKYVSLLSDYGFKYVFGKIANKDIIIAFLNAVIPDREIVDIEQLRNEQLPYRKDGKKSRFDLYCKTNDGSRVIIEMQNQEQLDFVERSIYYSTFPIQDQVDEGNKNYLFAPIYSISILNFNLEELKEESKVRSIFRLKDIDTSNELSDKFTFIYIELKKFNKRLEEIAEDNVLERFYYCLRNMEKFMERPAELQSEVFQKLFTAANIATMSPLEFNDYLQEMKTDRDYESFIWTAQQRGLKQGLEQGIQQVAKTMKEDGVPLEQIVKYTGLSPQEIDNL